MSTIPGANTLALARWIRIALKFLVVSVVVVAGSISAVAWYYGRNLPDYRKITEYHPPAGQPFVAIGDLPPVLIHAFLSAEDRNFFSHPGIDIVAIVRAMFVDVFRVASGQRPIGASTITQQLVRHFLLSDKLTLQRKIEEILLALRVERVLSKDRILELYVNTIYLGCRSWGVTEAAVGYFNEPVGKLTLPQAALIAGLPQAPSAYNPWHFPLPAKERRNRVLSLMVEDGYITAAQARAAKSAPALTSTEHTGKPC